MTLPRLDKILLISLFLQTLLILIISTWMRVPKMPYLLTGLNRRSIRSGRYGDLIMYDKLLEGIIEIDRNCCIHSLILNIFCIFRIRLTFVMWLGFLYVHA